MEESNGAVTARTDTLGRVVAALEKEGGGVPERAPCGRQGEAAGPKGDCTPGDRREKMKTAMMRSAIAWAN